MGKAIVTGILIIFAGFGLMIFGGNMRDTHPWTIYFLGAGATLVIIGWVPMIIMFSRRRQKEGH